MRNWESSASFMVFSLAAIIAAYAAAQGALIPFRFRLEVTRKPSGQSEMIFLERLKPLAYYESRFSTHSLFFVPKAEVVKAGPGIEQLVKPYHLVGIIQGAEPEALIENQSKRQTHFIQVGEPFDQFKLVEIKGHSVIVEYQNEQHEIYLEGGA